MDALGARLPQPGLEFPLEELTDCTAILQDFRNIPANTCIHKNRNGRFITTGGTNWSWMLGAQTAANLMKGHTPEKLAKDLGDYATAFGQTLTKVIAISTQMQDGSALSFVKMRILPAIGDLEKKKGALQELKVTYKDVPAVIVAVEGLISTLLNKGEEIEAILSKENLKSGISPEFLESDSQKLLPEQVGWSQYLFNYSTALYYNHWKYVTGEWNLHDKICEFEGRKLYLGVLPSQSYWQDTLEFMQKEGISAVLSVTEVFENQSKGIVLCPISPKTLLEANISQFQLPARDFGTLSIEEVELGVEYIHAKFLERKSVYVHCKAGRGRSALVVMCYLIKYHNKSAVGAFADVKQKRLQAGFKQTDPKWATLQQYEQKYRKGG